MELTGQDKALLARFQETFEVVAHSLGSQSFKINEHGDPEYEDIEIYGDTALLEIYYDDDVVHVIYEPRDDLFALLKFAEEWQEAGSPIPGSDSNSLFSV